MGSSLEGWIKEANLSRRSNWLCCGCNRSCWFPIQPLTFSIIYLRKSWVKEWPGSFLWYKVEESKSGIMRVVSSGVLKLLVLAQFCSELLWGRHQRFHGSKFCSIFLLLFKGPLSGLRQCNSLKFVQKWWKMLFISPWKIFSFSRYLNFCHDFLVETAWLER